MLMIVTTKNFAKLKFIPSLLSPFSKKKKTHFPIPILKLIHHPQNRISVFFSFKFKRDVSVLEGLNLSFQFSMPKMEGTD